MRGAALAVAALLAPAPASAEAAFFAGVPVDQGAASGDVDLAPGGSGALQNSACALALDSSTVTASGTTLTLQVAVTFAPGFAGAKLATPSGSKPLRHNEHILTDAAE